MNPMSISFDTFLNKKQKPRTVGRRKEYIAAAIAAHHHMVKTAGKMNSGFTCHQPKLNRECVNVKADPDYSSEWISPSVLGTLKTDPVLNQLIT